MTNLAQQQLVSSGVVASVECDPATRILMTDQGW